MALLYQNAGSFEGDGVSVEDIEKQLQRIYYAKQIQDAQKGTQRIQDIKNSYLGLPGAKKPWENFK